MQLRLTFPISESEEQGLIKNDYISSDRYTLWCSGAAHHPLGPLSHWRTPDSWPPQPRWLWPPASRSGYPTSTHMLRQRQKYTRSGWRMMAKFKLKLTLKKMGIVVIINVMLYLLLQHMEQQVQYSLNFRYVFAYYEQIEQDQWHLPANRQLPGAAGPSVCGWFTFMITSVLHQTCMPLRY